MKGCEIVEVEWLLLKFFIEVIIPAILAGVMVYIILNLCLKLRKDDDENGR